MTADKPQVRPPGRWGDPVSSPVKKYPCIGVTIEIDGTNVGGFKGSNTITPR
jgi:hypothetical protein